MKRFTCTLIVVTLMIVTLSITFATSAAKGKQAYGKIHYAAQRFNFPFIKDKAWSTITRNNDYPVSNSLYVGMWVQYQDGNLYKWLSPVEDFVQNAEKADVQKWHYNIYCIWTQFGASAAGCDRFDREVTSLISTY